MQAEEAEEAEKAAAEKAAAEKAAAEEAAAEKEAAEKAEQAAKEAAEKGVMRPDQLSRLKSITQARRAREAARNRRVTSTWPPS